MIQDPVLLHDWHAVASSADLTEGAPRAARLLGEDLVLWRVAGEVRAWKDLCIHRGAKLSLGQRVQDRLACPYHGWQYDSSGRCVHIPAHPEQVPPAKAQALPYSALERCGLIWVCLAQPEQEPPAPPEWEDAAYRKVLCGPYDLQAAGPRVIENFLDVAHFPFVHPGLLGAADRPALADYEAEIRSDGVIARNVRIWQPNPDGSGQGAEATYTYRTLRPLTAHFTKTAGGPPFAAFFTVSPIDLLHSRAWLLLAVSARETTSEEEFRTFEDAIMAQDIPIVESQRPELLPLDLQAELHLRSDRTAIAYRRWLSLLGVTFGTA